VQRLLLTAGRKGAVLAAGQGKTATRIDFHQCLKLDGKTHLLKSATKIGRKPVSDRLGKGTETTYALSGKEPVGVEATLHVLEYKARPFAVMYMSLVNRSSTAVTVDEIHLVETTPGKPLELGGATVMGTRFAHTNMARGCFVQGLSKNPEAQGLNVIYNTVSGVALNTSFLTFEQALSRIKAPYNYRSSHLWGLEIWQPFGGFSLKPGKRTRTDRLYIEVTKDPQGSLERHADQVAKWYKTNPNVPALVGWVGWVTCERWFDSACSEILEDQAKRNITAIKRRLGGLGVENEWVSQANFYKDIPMEWEPGTVENVGCYPKGFGAFSKWLRRHGFRVGLWVMPFRMVSVHSAIKTHTEMILKDKNGSWKPLITNPDACNTPGEHGVQNHTWRWGVGSFGPMKWEDRPEVWILDTSHPQALKWIEETMRKLTIGADTRWYMLDFLDGPNVLDADFYDKSLIPGVQAYRKGLKACRRGTGKGVILNSCSSATLEPIGLVDTARVAPDYVESVKTALSWETNKNEFLQAFSHYFTHRKFYLNESMLVLTVGEPIPMDTARWLATCFSFTDGTMWLGDDIDYLPEERVDLIRKGLPKYPQVGRPLNMFDYPCDQVCPPIIYQTIERKWDTWHCLGLFNFEENTRDIEINATDFGHGSSQQLSAFDFWNEKFLGIFKKSLTVPVDTKAKQRVVSLRKARNRPFIVGTNIHITQGGVELEDVKWNTARNTLSGKVIRPKGNTGKIFIYVPEGYSYRGSEFKGARGRRSPASKGNVMLLDIIMAAGRAEFSARFAHRR